MTTFEIAYVGTLLGGVDANQPFLGVLAANPTVDVNAIRPFVGYAGFYDRVLQFDSNYNSLQVH